MTPAPAPAPTPAPAPQAAEPQRNPLMRAPLPAISSSPDSLRQFYVNGIPVKRILPPPAAPVAGIKGDTGVAGKDGKSTSASSAALSLSKVSIPVTVSVANNATATGTVHLGRAFIITSVAMSFNPVPSNAPSNATVNVNTLPWDQTVSGNSAYAFGNGATGVLNTGTAPITVAVTAGTAITVTASGTVYWGGVGSGVNANGTAYPSADPFPDGTGITAGSYPAKYIAGATSSGPILFGGLMGAFTDNAGKIVSSSAVVALGVGPTLLVVPPGATNLSLGVNNNLQITSALLSGSSGNFSVTVNTVSGAARVQLYSSSAAQVADASRPSTVGPNVATSHGVILDLYLDPSTSPTPGTPFPQTWNMSPEAFGYDAGSGKGDITYALTNNCGITTAITVTFTGYQLDS